MDLYEILHRMRLIVHIAAIQFSRPDLNDSQTEITRYKGRQTMQIQTYDEENFKMRSKAKYQKRITVREIHPWRCLAIRF